MRTKFLVLILLVTTGLLLSSFDKDKTETSASKQFIVVLDAGHGGKDPGNLGNNYKEKDIALNIVLQVGKELEKNPLIKVIYTRKTDVFLDLKERAAIANKADADLFVSVHCDSHTSNAFGAGTFVLGLHANKRNFELAKKENSVIFMEDDYETKYDGFDPNAPESLIGITIMQEEFLDQSILLASMIQDNFKTIKRKNRDVKQAGFWVLHNTYMPSVLIETGFLTNKTEGAYLNSKKGQIEMSNAIEDAILKYMKAVSSNDVGSVNSQKQDNPDQVVTNTNSNQKNTNSDVVYKVQIAASSKKLQLKPYNFKGLQNISILQEGSLYKYFYDKTTSFEKANEYRKIAVEKGYNSAFVVAFKDGVKVPLSSVLKSTPK